MTLTAGSKLGPYEILAPIGAGGMGEVYRARDERLKRDVAIKVLPPELAADPERRARFEREARAASGLSHPNILTVYDIGTHESNVYIAMELVEGGTLKDLSASGPVPVEKLLDVSRPDRRRPRRGARGRDRAPGPEAAERHGLQARVREDPGLRPRQARHPGGPGGVGPADGGGRPDASGDGDGHGRLHVAGAGGGARRSTSGRTSSRSARSSTRWRPASAPSSAARPPRR